MSRSDRIKALNALFSSKFLLTRSSSSNNRAIERVAKETLDNGLSYVYFYVPRPRLSPLLTFMKTPAR